MRLVPVLFLVALLAKPVAAEEPSEAESAKGSPVVVAEVVARPVSTGRTFVGTIEPSRRSVVGSEFGGIVVDLLVHEGDRVEAKVPLARLRTDILDLRIESAEADVELARQRLLELENGSRPEEIAQARARVTELEAGLELRKWKLEASKKLFVDKTISEDEIRDARLAVRASELLLAAAQSALALVEAGPRVELIAQRKAEVTRFEAEVKRLEDQRERYTIRAPFAGWVVEEHTEVGQWLGVGAPIASLIALDEVDARVDVSEDFVGRLEVGMSSRVAIDAVPGRIFTGTVHRIVPSADRRGRTFPVEIRLPNESQGKSVLLKAGMFASATLAVGDETPAVLVPKDAIVLGGMVPIMVWTVDRETSTAQMVPVQLGVAVDDLVQVKGPLEPGAMVVVRGNERIFFPGQQLKVVK